MAVHMPARLAECNMPLIEVTHLEKTYRDGDTETRALKEATFMIERGDFVAIMGPSGSGKSTLLHILGFLEPNTGGEYRFNGKTYSEYSNDEVAQTRNAKMGFVFQAFNLLPRLSVLENVKLPLLYAAVPEKEWDERATAAIQSVGLSHRLHHAASRLSGGEKQRVAIARALINNPHVIFADEPTGNLDLASGVAIMEILTGLNREKGHTIILITHEINIAAYAKRKIIIRDGNLVEDVVTRL